MASVVSRGSRWYVKYRDHRGKWVRRPTTARTKTEARRLADDVERRCERQRLGLEPIPDEAGGGTLGELAEWWLKTYSVELASHQRNTFTLGKHLLASSLAELRLVDVILAKQLEGGDPNYNEASISAMHPMNRLGRPEEIANGICFLLSDEASFVTGHVLNIDGGFQAK
jgi:hypothetical protein